MTKNKDAGVSNQTPRRSSVSNKTGQRDVLVERAIGSRLRSYYDGIADEPVPDRFVELLKRLEDQDAGKR